MKGPGIVWHTFMVRMHAGNRRHEPNAVPVAGTHGYRSARSILDGRKLESCPRDHILAVNTWSTRVYEYET